MSTESIRINQEKIENLPLAERGMAITQLPEAIEIQKQNKKNIILAKYPKATKKYLRSRIEEAKENIERVSNASADMLKQIRNYETIMDQCRIRDEEIKFLENDHDKEEKTKQLFKETPPYSISAMEQQINQWDESIVRCNEVIKVEYLSIAELNGTLSLCEMSGTILDVFRKVVRSTVNMASTVSRRVFLLKNDERNL